LSIKGYEGIKLAAVERCETERQQVRRQLGLDVDADGAVAVVR
jgi:hypothetical protein